MKVGRGWVWGEGGKGPGPLMAVAGTRIFKHLMLIINLKIAGVFTIYGNFLEFFVIICGASIILCFILNFPVSEWAQNLCVPARVTVHVHLLAKPTSPSAYPSVCNCFHC